MPGAVFAILLSAFQLFSFSAFPQVSLAWSAPSCTNAIASYNLYFGTSPRTYDLGFIALDPCLTTTIYLPYAPPALTYLALTAIDSDGLESDFSNEVCCTNPAALTNLALTVTTTGASILFACTVSGPWEELTNAASITLINPIPPIYFRSLGWATNQIEISATPF